MLDSCAQEKPFVFDDRWARYRVTDSAILAGLKRFGKIKGGAFTRKAWDAWAEKPCGSEPIIARMGKWHAVLARVGIKRVRYCRYTPEEYMDVLEEVWREVGGRPRARQMLTLGGVTTWGYIKHWGSYRAACERMMKYHRGAMTRDLLVKPAGRTYARGVRPGVRWKVLERDGRRCVVCGASGDEPGVRLEVDHIVPACRGGKGVLENLRTLCRACNRGRGKRDAA